MNRRRIQVNQKNFVSGGVYVANDANKIPNTPSAQKQQVAEQAPISEPVIVMTKVEDVQPLEPPPENPFKECSMEYENSESVDSNGKVRFKKIFMNRKKASVRAKEKRIRQNRRLRKTLIPKNGLMALNELKGISISEFTINVNPGGGFIALVTVNDSQYEGRGSSKAAAKNNACDKALRDFILAKLREYPRNQKSATNTNEGIDTSDDNAQTTSNSIADADDVPMINLASFAIYKLFADWESEGYVIPEMHPASGGNMSENEGAVVPKEPKKAPIRNELPPNWEMMHPASLLCMMRPGVTYVDKGCKGVKPHVLQSLEVTVDDQEFAAVGRSKKLARRNVAALACNTLFNTNYELDSVLETATASN